MFRKLPSRGPMLTNRLAEEAPVVANAVGSREERERPREALGPAQTLPFGAAERGRDWIRPCCQGLDHAGSGKDRPEGSHHPLTDREHTLSPTPAFHLSQVSSFLVQGEGGALEALAEVPQTLSCLQARH